MKKNIIVNMQKNSIVLEFPIYYTQKFKTKKDKKLLVGLNNYRNWHHYLSNAIKIYYHNLTKEKIGTIPRNAGQDSTLAPESPRGYADPG